MTEPRIRISLSKQQLQLCDADLAIQTWPISSAANGAGQTMNTGCTPLGRHRLRLKIGQGCAPNTVFIGRRPTGEIYTDALGADQPQRDWILSRILWLTGCEPGYNRGGQCDTLRRYIYIHGTPDSEPMGIPVSHGCIRMRNDALIQLFEQVANGDLVDITD